MAHGGINNQLMQQANMYCQVPDNFVAEQHKVGPFFLLFATDNSLLGIVFAKPHILNRGTVPTAALTLVNELEKYCRGERVAFTFTIPKQKTSFAFDVYSWLVHNVGWGELCTYGEIAKAIGKPKAARAVGAAMARNPWPVIVPCHRVLEVGAGRSDSKNYAGGVALKRTLLVMESRV